MYLLSVPIAAEFTEFMSRSRGVIREKLHGRSVGRNDDRLPLLLLNIDGVIRFSITVCRRITGMKCCKDTYSM